MRKIYNPFTKHSSIATALVLLLVAGMACRSENSSNATTKQQIDSITAYISASDLSENLTGNDELAMFVYKYSNGVLSKPLLVKKLWFDRRKSVHQIQFPMAEAINTELLIVLIELDTDASPAAIDSTLRVSHHSIRTAFTQRDYNGIQKFLGDDDILGAKQISLSGENTTIYFKGTYKLDKYEYLVQFQFHRRN